MMNQKKFHIEFDGQRTTISVDAILFELLAIRLRTTPDSVIAHGLVRDWLQDKLVSSLGDESGRKSASQFARRYLIEEISDNRLHRKWQDWWIDS